MNEVRKWLDTIGLAQYADAFETNDLDVDLLGQVDDQLLKDIGVSSAGHCLRIRNAITKLGCALSERDRWRPADVGWSGIRRAPSSDGYVLGLGWFNSTLDPHGP